MVLTGAFVFFSMVAAGKVTAGVMTNIGIFIIPYLLANWFGIWLFKQLPGNVFRLIILWLLVAISISIIVF